MTMTNDHDLDLGFGVGKALNHFIELFLNGVNFVQ